jgi:polysaccharide deacetylase family protein (PEP-CTERM system associated)
MNHSLPIRNLLSIDLEDWHQLLRRRLTGAAGPVTCNIDRQLDVVLQLFADHQVKATFFCLGLLAEARPDVIRRVAAAGHEIASHGYAHYRVYELGPERFRDDTARGKALLEDLIGEQIVGYRAANFSITRDALWALKILAELGFEYDSSIFPIHHRRYGIADFNPLAKRYTFGKGLVLTEVPLAVVRRAGQNLPFAGGGYFRLLPLSVLIRNFEQVNASGVPVMTYFHPYEFDPEPLDALEGLERVSWRQWAAGKRLNWHQNLGRHSLRYKLLALLQRFRFTTIRESLSRAQLDEGRELLRAASV